MGAVQQRLRDDSRAMVERAEALAERVKAELDKSCSSAAFIVSSNPKIQTTADPTWGSRLIAQKSRFEHEIPKVGDNRAGDRAELAEFGGLCFGQQPLDFSVSFVVGSRQIMDRPHQSRCFRLNRRVRSRSHRRHRCWQLDC